MKKYVKLNYSIFYEDMNKEFFYKLNTTLYEDEIKENGDNQKKWLKTLRQCSKKEGFGYKLSKGTKFISCEIDEIRTDKKYRVRYNKVSLNFQPNRLPTIPMEEIVNSDGLFEILRFSNHFKGNGVKGTWSYTDGTYYSSNCKNIWWNEDIEILPVG